jgi:hypothetical protein
MKRNFTIIIFIFLLSALTLRFLFTPSKEDWITFSKTDKGVETHPTTVKEKKINNIPTQIPQAKKAPHINEKKTPKRKMVGLPKGKTIDDLDLEYKNEINRDWKVILGEILLKDQQGGNKVFIKKVDGILEIKGNQATYFEIAIIKFLDNEGNQSSFRAMVNSGTGKIKRRWDKTIFENYKRERKGLTPSGTLKSN